MYSNGVYSKDYLLSQLDDCTELCYFSDTFKDYLSSNSKSLETKSLSCAVQSISSNLAFINNSYVYDQSSWLNGYLSTISISDTYLRDMESSTNILQITQSTLTVNRMDARRLETSDSGFLFSSSFETDLAIENLNYQDSTMKMLRVITSTSSIKDTKIENITLSSSNLISYNACEDIKLVNVTIDKVLTDQSEIISVVNTEVDQMSILSISNANTAAIMFDQCVINQIESIMISNNSRGLIFRDTELRLLKDSYFDL